MAVAGPRTQVKMPVVLDVRVVTETGGGPDKTILNSPRFFRDRGYHNLCAYMYPPKDAGFNHIRARAKHWEAPLLEIEDHGPWDVRILHKLLSICRKHRVRIWHGHDYKSNLIGLMLRPFWTMHLVTTVHGWVKHTNRTPLYYKIDKACLPRYESIICVSKDLMDVCIEEGVPANRCVTIENGIDTATFQRTQTGNDAKKRLGLRPDRELIGGVGRLSKEKGFDVLIQTVSELIKDGRPIELALVGDGAEREPLQALAKNLRIEDRVHFLGYREDPRQIYEAMDVFVLSSFREGLPNVLLEALALEVPVVATRIAGVPKLIQDGVNGFLVEPGSIESLKSAVNRIFTSNDCRHRFTELGRQLIVNEYSFSRRTDRVQAIYDRLLKKAP